MVETLFFSIPSLPLTPSVVQSKSGDATSAASVSVVMDSTPTEGNLLVCLVTGVDNAGFAWDPTGWTLVKSQIATWLLSFGLASIYYKFAGASEPTTQTMDISGPSCEYMTMGVVEVSNINSDDPVDTSDSDDDTGSTDLTAYSGQITSTAQANGIAFVNLNLFDDDFTTPLTDSNFDNSFVMDEYVQGPGSGRANTSGMAHLIYTEAQSNLDCTMTLSGGGNEESIGVIATFNGGFE